MSRAASFRQSELKSAIKACLDAGLSVGEFEVSVDDAGRPVVRTLTPGARATAILSPLEAWEQKCGRSAA